MGACTVHDLCFTRYYDGETGEITGDMQKLPGLHNYASFREYTWDSVGRMTSRAELSGVPLHEGFEYDGHNRLTGVWSGGDSNPMANPRQQRVRYGLSGNILCKSDVFGADCGSSDQNYHYQSGRPHAVTQVVTDAGTRVFAYDNNGSVVQDRIGTTAQRSFEYTAFNKLRRVCRYTCGQAASTEFYYGPDRARFLKRELNGIMVQARTHYLGSVEFEFEGNDLDAPRIRRVIAGVAIEIIESDTGIGTLRYQHKDHLGSTVALSTSGGQVLTRMHFDPWGQRQDLSGELWNQWGTSGQPDWANAMLDITPRGFTGHEHLDDHGIIHMNGRIYDPHLGRFLQADPFIEDTGTLNRYTYVHNNPLAFTDPSGFFSFKKFARTALSIGVAVGATVVGGPGLTTAILGGALSGAIATGSIEGALWGAFSGAVFFGIGQHFSAMAEANRQFAELGWIDAATLGANTNLTAGQFAAQSLSHAIAGGTLNTMQGGRFGHGFLSAGVSKAATPTAMSVSRNAFAQGAAVAIVGGTTSRISGGKFANGATTAAMAYAFSSAARSSQPKGEWIFPEGGSTDMNDYDTVMTNGILGDRDQFVLAVNAEQIPGYFNPSSGALGDIFESIGQKFFGWAGDSLAAGFSQGLAGVDHPMRIIAHSQGTLTVANAAKYYGLPQGSTLIMRSPAISRWRANSAANAIGGSMQYVQPYGDIANIYAPSLNPVRWMSGFRDVFCGACTHTANGLP
jgi:RHS repeat-associated protein